MQANLQFSHLPKQGDPGVGALLQAVSPAPISMHQVDQPAAHSQTPASAHESPIFDLRKLLMSIQFSGSTSLPTDEQHAQSATESASLAGDVHYPDRVQMLHAARVAESLSWVDAELATVPLREMDVSVAFDLVFFSSSRQHRSCRITSRERSTRRTLCWNTRA